MKHIKLFDSFIGETITTKPRIYGPTFMQKAVKKPIAFSKIGKVTEYGYYVIGYHGSDTDFGGKTNVYMTTICLPDVKRDYASILSSRRIKATRKMTSLKKYLMNDLELANKLRERLPEIKKEVTTGIHECQCKRGLKILEKTLNDKELLTTKEIEDFNI